MDNVRNFVGDDGLKFVPRHFIQHALSHANDRVFDHKPCTKGIQRRIRNDIGIRRGNASRDRHLGHHAGQPTMLRHRRLRADPASAHAGRDTRAAQSTQRAVGNPGSDTDDDGDHHAQTPGKAMTGERELDVLVMPGDPVRKKPGTSEGHRAGRGDHCQPQQQQHLLRCPAGSPLLAEKVH